jgi:amino acid transporter
MSTVTPAHALKRNSIGIAAIIFFVVAAAAPLAASVATAPIVFGYAGVSAPLVYVVIGSILLLFSFGYAAMSHHVTSAAGLAAFVEAGLGRRAGFAAAFVAMLSYSVFVMGLYGGFGFTASYVLDSLFGLSVNAYVCAALAWAAVAVLGYRAVELNVRVLGVLLLLEIAVLLVFDVVSTAKGGAEGISMAAFVPSNLEVGGGIGIALLFAAVAFLGFEATAIYGEEVKAPRQSVAVATYASVIVIAGFYTLTMWALGNAYGVDNVVAAASTNPAGFVLDVIPTYLGDFALDVVNVLVVTSYFAAILALHNTLSRYVMALGRAGAVPTSLGRVHPDWRSPHAASFGGSAASGLVVLLFALAGIDPFVMFGWLTGVGTLGIFVLQGLASIAVIVFFRRGASHAGAWSTTIAPALAFVGIATVIVLGLQNWDLLSGATSGLAQQLPWLIPLAAVVGAASVTLRSGVRSLSVPIADEAGGTGAAVHEDVRPDPQGV